MNNPVVANKTLPKDENVAKSHSTSLKVLNKGYNNLTYRNWLKRHKKELKKEVDKEIKRKHKEMIQKDIVQKYPRIKKSKSKQFVGINTKRYKNEIK